jgi:hypothetical protein
MSPRRVLRWAERVKGRLALLGYLVLAFFVVLGLYFNTQRVNEIQASRVASCRQTYEAFHEVFKPFFRPPAQQTPKERRDIAKFNSTIDRLKAKCGEQTSTKGTK